VGDVGGSGGEPVVGKNVSYSKETEVERGRGGLGGGIGKGQVVRLSSLSLESG